MVPGTEGKWSPPMLLVIHASQFLRAVVDVTGMHWSDSHVKKIASISIFFNYKLHALFYFLCSS